MQWKTAAPGYWCRRAILATALAALLADPARCRTMGVHGRERILAGFSEEQVVAETLAVYSYVLAEAGL